MNTKIDSLSLIELNKLSENFRGSAPYNHMVTDNFFPEDIALKLASKFTVFEVENVR